MRTVGLIIDTQDNSDITKMTVTQLKAFAADNGYDIGDATKKEDIVATIIASTPVEMESSSTDALQV